MFNGGGGVDAPSFAAPSAAPPSAAPQHAFRSSLGGSEGDADGPSYVAPTRGARRESLNPLVGTSADDSLPPPLAVDSEGCGVDDGPYGEQTTPLHTKILRSISQAHADQQLRRGVVEEAGAPGLTTRALLLLGVSRTRSDSASSSPKIEQLGLQCGWLLKPSFRRKEQRAGFALPAGTTHCFNPNNWWRRYFVLHDACLVHYKNESDARQNRRCRGRLELHKIDHVRRSAVYDAPAHCFDLVHVNGSIFTLGLPHDDVIGSLETIQQWRRCFSDAIEKAKVAREAFEASHARELQFALRAFPQDTPLAGWLMHTNMERPSQLHSHVADASERRKYQPRAYHREFFRLELRTGRLIFWRKEEQSSHPSKMSGFIDLRRVHGVQASAQADCPRYSVDLIGPDRMYTLGIDPSECDDDAAAEASIEFWKKRLLIEVYYLTGAADAERVISSGQHPNRTSTPRNADDPWGAAVVSEVEPAAVWGRGNPLRHSLDNPNVGVSQLAQHLRLMSPRGVIGGFDPNSSALA